jgi:hypothetical protein
MTFRNNLKEGVMKFHLSSNELVETWSAGLSDGVEIFDGVESAQFYAEQVPALINALQQAYDCIQQQKEKA